LLDTYTPLGVHKHPMIRTNIWLREDHQNKLKVISEKTGAPVSALIRKAIEEYLKKQK
jgi:predicted DNA-binding protein